MSEVSQLSFDGADFVQELDGCRLSGQIARVYAVMKDERERSVKQIQDAIYKRFGVVDPENSIQAQLRNLRKPRGGFRGFNVECLPKNERGFHTFVLHGAGFWDRDEVPVAIKEPPLLAYSADGKSVRLTRFVEKPKWIELDVMLRGEGFDYRGRGLWRKER